MATTCPTTEAALQAGLLPAQERWEGCFAKVSGRLKKFQTACNLRQKCVRAFRRRSDSRIRRLFEEQEVDVFWP